MRVSILGLLLFCCFSTIAQTKVLQSRDIIYLYNSANVTTGIYCEGIDCRNYLFSGGDTLCTIYDNGVVFWKATLSASNISDTLSASGITGLCRVTVPTSINTQRIIQYDDIVLIYSINDYTLFYPGIYSQSQFPATIIRNSDNVTMCTLYRNGIIDWVTTPSMSWLGRVGTTRFKRITLP